MDTTIKPTKISRTLIKVIVVNGVNILVLMAIFLILSQVSKKSLEVRELNSKSIGAEQLNTDLLKADIERVASSSSKLKELFNRDETVITFISSVDTLKKENILKSVDFPATSPVTDKLGGTGLPVTLNFVGSLDLVNQSLISMSKIPVLLKPITFSLTFQETGELDVKLGAFLYLN